MEISALTRSVVKHNHAIISPDGYINSNVPGWTNCTVNVIINEQMGARLCQTIVTLREGGRLERAPSWLPDSRHLVFANEGKAYIADTSTKKVRELLGRPTEQIRSVGVSRHGRLLYYTLNSTESDVWLLNLDHAAHERLRRIDLRAAEQLAVAAVRVLADHFDLLDHRISAYLAEHPDDHPKATEWSDFRARLFEESNL